MKLLAGEGPTPARSAPKTDQNGLFLPVFTMCQTDRVLRTGAGLRGRSSARRSLSKRTARPAPAYRWSANSIDAGGDAQVGVV